jgi:UDP-N-acetylglucosamine--N-acetylmuramyl-(pentapeptide) pyrophosphoryl-undecaprenol N-acetylglucosamine transferase
MTTSEFLAWGIPAILVPLPSSAADHQASNAQSLQMAGAALHLPESEATGESLWQAAVTLLDDPDRLGAMREAAVARGRPGASRKIAEELAAVLPLGPEEVG